LNYKLIIATCQRSVVQGKLILRSIILSSSNNCLDLKNNRKYTGKVSETEIATVLPLEGRATENGTYECRWDKSRGEARHRRFIVSFTTVEKIDGSEAKSFAAVNDISIIFAL
jgi:hypothetical protein